MNPIPAPDDSLAPDIATLPLPPESAVERDANGLMYINICGVINLIYPHPSGHWWNNTVYQEDDWDAQSAKVMQYAAVHNLHYYARCKEDFFTHEAGCEARAAGKSGVILDNLS